MPRRSLQPIHEAEFKRRYGSSTDEELAEHFNVTEAAIRTAAAQFALAKDKAWMKRQGLRAQMPRWTDDQLAELRRLYPSESNEAVAHALGRSVKAVAAKAHQLELHKDQRRLIEMGRCNVQRRYR